jgi:hypothetical protein
MVETVREFETSNGIYVARLFNGDCRGVCAAQAVDRCN